MLFLLALLAACAGYVQSQVVQDAAIPAAAASSAVWTDHSGWYVHPRLNRFLALARKHNTDKVTDHNYQTVYGRAFELHPGHYRTHKMLEIGLGCDMSYGPGHSAKVWREYLPNAELWFAEYDAACVQTHQSTLDQLRIKAVTGDQGDIPTLYRWVNETGGMFDVIIDDGGHKNMLIFNAFSVLFQHALKPGGLYVVEDIFISRSPGFVDGDGQHFTIEIFKDWLDDLVMRPGGITQTKWERPKRLKLMECSTHYCAFVKCFDDDPACDMKRRDRRQLLEEGQEGRAVKSGRTLSRKVAINMHKESVQESATITELAALRRQVAELQKQLGDAEQSLAQCVQ